MGALVFLTFLVLVQIPLRRFRAAFAGRVKAHDFKYGESAQVPGDVSIPNRNYMNLLELPVLFYVLCTVLLVTGKVTAIELGLAWAYVVLRAIHSLVHLTYHNIWHRLIAFVASNIVLAGMWVLFFVRYIGSPA